jgi:hypothetical protein
MNTYAVMHGFPKKVGELFRPVGRTEHERVLLGVLEGEAL